MAETVRSLRVLFLTLYPDQAASPRYRVGQFVPYLRGRGVECVVASAVGSRRYAASVDANRVQRAAGYHLEEMRRRFAQIREASRYDIVFLQKALMSAYVRGMEGMLFRHARRVIYDIDDAVHLAPPHPLRGLWKWIEARDQVIQIMRRADRVLAGNRWLEREASAAGANAEYFPTVVNTARFRPPALPGDRFQIGWLGSRSTTPYLAVVESLLASADAEVNLVGADPRLAPRLAAYCTPWSLDTEVERIQRFTVGIMPMPKSEWTKGKCALKALQYMACGVPCIATPWGAACDIIEHGVNGFLADSPDEWLAAIDQARDPGVWRRLGEAARATVESRYSLDGAAPRMLEILEGIR